MLVLETTAAGVNPPLSDPNAGRLVRVEYDGSLTPLAQILAALYYHSPSSSVAYRRNEV